MPDILSRNVLHAFNNEIEKQAVVGKVFGGAMLGKAMRQARGPALKSLLPFTKLIGKGAKGTKTVAKGLLGTGALVGAAAIGGAASGPSKSQYSRYLR